MMHANKGSIKWNSFFSWIFIITLQGTISIILFLVQSIFFMNKHFSAFALLTILFFSCTKKDNTYLNSELNWKLDNTTYSGLHVADSISGSWYAYAENSMFILSFKDSLTTGNYQIVALANNAAQMNLAVSKTIDGVPNYYSSKSNNSAFIAVTINSKNKTVVNIPVIWVYNTFNNLDSVKVSGIITK